MSRPPKHPDWVYRCRICKQSVRIPARIACTQSHFPPACNGGTEHRHKFEAMQRVEVSA